MVSFRDGVALAAVGWWLSPILAFLLNKLLSYLYDESKKLIEMRSGTVRLKNMLEEAVNYKIKLSEKKHENTEVSDDDALLRDLKNALDEAEDILDLIDYHRIEKEVDDTKTSWLQWCWQRIYDRTREISVPLLQLLKKTLCWLWQCLRVAGGRSAPLLQRVHQRFCWLWHYVRFTREKSAALLQLDWQGLSWLWQCMPTSEELLPVASTASTSSVQRIPLWVRSFDFKNLCSCIFKWLSKAIEGVRYYRDWSFHEFGFTGYQQRVSMESNCCIMWPLYIKLKKNMAKVEDLIDEAQKNVSFKKKLEETIADTNQSRASKSGTNDSNAGETQAAVTTGTPPLAVIGRDKDCDKIVAMLQEREEDGQADIKSTPPVVIGIHGITGSGKSTLAQMVFAREKKNKKDQNAGHFDLVMWVHVSQKFNVDTIFKEMTEAATGSCPHLHNLDTLQSNLEEILNGKRFLLVLDDIWYSNGVQGDTTQHAKLQKILLPLNAGKAGSKILVTSRTENALLAVGAAKGRCIPMPFLEDDVFLNLFMHYALHSLPTDDPLRRQLKEIGEVIAKKLKGSPLAATVVGALLCRNQNLEYWRKIRDQNLWNETMGALWWSYQDLHEKVRRCFAYCSIFPRRRRLERDELVKLWTAQGFAGRGNEGEGMEDVCRDCFDELVSASFLERRAKEYLYKEDYYVIHDLLYDLAEKVTGSDCLRIENLQSLPEVEHPLDVRHVFLQTCDATLITEKICKLDNLRTLIIHDVKGVQEKVLLSMFERLRKLRVLIMTWSVSHDVVFSVPASIGQLRHLRYLAFRGYEYDRVKTELVLAGTLTKLYHMQVLDFNYMRISVFSSEGISALINLRHLISNKDMEVQNIGRLTSLRTLSSFVRAKDEGYELKQLGNLDKLSGSLRIDHLQNVETQQEALDARLADKEGLRNLDLWWDGVSSPEVQAEVLEGLCPPTGLETLEIHDYKGVRYPSWMLGKHNGGPKYLKHLTFHGCDAEPVPELLGFVTHLRTLIIWECSWQALPDCIEQLASLQTLCIYYCKDIRSFPTLPQSLRSFTFCDCNEVLMSACKTIGDPYWRKIKHIPWARIGDYWFQMGVCTKPGHTTTCKDGDSSTPEQTRHRPPKRKFKCRTKKEECDTIIKPA